jgi:hypothetical protein
MIIERCCGWMGGVFGYKKEGEERRTLKEASGLMGVS